MKKMTKVIATACVVLTMATTTAAFTTSAFAAENNSISVSSLSESNTSIDDIAKHIQELRTEVYKVNTQIRSISMEIAGYQPTDPKRAELEAQRDELIAKAENLNNEIAKYQKAESLVNLIQTTRKEVYNINTQIRSISMEIAGYQPTDPKRAELEAQRDELIAKADNLNTKIAEYQKIVDDILGNA